MEQNSEIKDKRKNKRRKVKITALLKMGVFLNGRGYAKDISLNGMLLESPSIFKSLKTTQVKDLIGTSLKVMFPSPSITVSGTIVRIDSKKGEGAISVTNTTDDDLWKELCSKEE